MPKELIISANVHEKKVAILEDGVVTEFYVERRDENQGVVGNLYKGRVMKVLPGMQSAFVDIGLERDAFLYVSDFTEFMEEEDEIDFREAGEQKPPRMDERQRRDRPQRPQTVPPPQAAAALDQDQAARLENAVEHVAEIAVERVIPTPPPDDLPAQLGPETDEAQVRPLSEFSFQRITDELPAAPGGVEPFEETPAVGEAEIDTLLEAPERAAVESAAEEEPAVRPKRGARGKKAAEEADKPKSRRGTTARKPAARQKRGAHSEAAPEDATEDAAAPSTHNSAAERESFERITDDEVTQDAGEFLKDAMVQEKIIERIHEAEYQTGPVQSSPEPEWKVGSFKTPVEVTGFQRVIDDTAQSAGERESDLGEEGGGSPFKHVSGVVSAFYNRLRSRSGETPRSADERPESFEATQQEDYSEAGSIDSVTEDREAEIRDRGPRSEFAVRRGGRGRRGRRRPDNHQQAQAAASEAPASEAEPQNDAAAEQPKEPAAQAAAPEVVNANGASEEAESREARPDDQRGGRQRFDRRAEQQRRAELLSRRKVERTASPTISELLHEGQEILVQIAKEPIAKKGARITSHIALPGRYLVYMPTVNHVGVSRKIPNEMERVRLKRTVAALRERENAPGGFIARTACAGHTEQELWDDMRYLLRTWTDIRKKAERTKSPALVHRDLDLVQRILRDQLSEEFTAIRIDNEVEYARIVEFVNRVQPRLVKRVKLHVGNQPILEKYGVQPEIDKAVRPRVWLKSGGYIVINQTEALVAIDVNTGKFVGKSDKLEDTITRTNLEAAKEVVRQVRLRDLGGIIVIDFIDMEERKNRQKVLMAVQQELANDRAPSKILSINDFGLVAITRKRVKQSLERTLCAPCPYCQGAGMVKSAQTMCFEILEQAKAISKQLTGSNDVMLRVSPHVAESLRTTEREVMEEVEAYFGTPVTIEPDPNLHQEQFDFAIV